MFTRIFLGIVGIALSFLVVKYRYTIQEAFGGSFSWAERYLGSTELAIVLMAVLIFITSLLYMTGRLNGMLVSIFGSIF